MEERMRKSDRFLFSLDWSPTDLRVRFPGEVATLEAVQSRAAREEEENSQVQDQG